jgi:hypothetical protein
MNFNHVREGAVFDTRINSSHSIVNTNERGYGGTCFPKDTNSLLNIFESNGVESPLLNANLFRNEYLDNNQKTWLSIYDRAITQFQGTITLCINEISLGLVNDERNLIIFFKHSLSDTKELRKTIYTRYWNPENNILIPRCDVLVYHELDVLCIHTKIQQILQVLTFIKTYHVQAIFHLHSQNSFLHEWIDSEITSFNSRVKIEFF